MTSTTIIIMALYATLLHIMYIISFASGFLLLPLSPLSTLHYQQNFHDSNVMILQATRQADILTASTQKTTPRPSTKSNSYNPFNNNNSQQQTQFFKDNVLVNIHRTSSNSRRISGEMIMNNIPIDIIWEILTDYDNLSDHVPNLVESKIIGGGAVAPRVYQKGAQRIFGFEFGADVTLDMREHIYQTSRRQVIDFKCVDSQFFSEFDGSWIVEEYNTEEDDLSSSTSRSTSEPITIVRYIVDVRPKGVVPVAALEWRIKEDVPVNIVAVAKAATAAMEQRHQQELLLSEQQRRSSPHTKDVSSQGTHSYQRFQKDPSSSSTRRSPRRRQPASFQQPLQRLTNQAANNLKQTAKSILPKPVISTAKQAINIINNNRRRNDAPLQTVSRLQSTGRASSELKKDYTGGISSSSNDMEVDWYDDETMAMYL